MTRYDLRRIAEGLECQATEDENRAKHLLWRAGHLRKRLVRLHDELDAMGVPDPEMKGDAVRSKVDERRPV